MYLHSATSHGAAFNDDAQLALGYPQKTIYEKLTENGKSWGSYFSEGRVCLRRPDLLCPLRGCFLALADYLFMICEEIKG